MAINFIICILESDTPQVHIKDIMGIIMAAS